MSAHTDIKSKGWVGRVLPRSWQPYAILGRFDRPIGSWLLLLPGLWAVVLASGGTVYMRAEQMLVVFLFILGAPLMRAAGCVVNDLWDKDLDKHVERTAQRPLAAGLITPKQALVFLTWLLSLSFIILLQLPMVTIALGVCVLPLIAVYPLMKRVTWWPQLFLGITFNFSILMGWSAVRGRLDIEAFILYAGAICWTLAYDTIYAHQDKEGDALIGIKSSALKLGKYNEAFIAVSYALFFTAVLIVFSMLGKPFASFAILIAALFYAAGFLKSWDPHSPSESLSCFKSSRNVGLLVLIAAFF